LTAWIDAARAARQANLIHHARPLPTELSARRSSFEAWWTSASLETKRRLSPAVVQEALSLTARLYRMQELQSETKPAALFWADEAIRYFEQISARHELVEALLDKAAIHLELSQIEHTDPDLFRQVAQDGDSVMARAASVADDGQLPGAYRMWSRFFQNLARPRSGKLSDAWDNTYLQAAYAKVRRATELDPQDLKNVTQLARVAQRLAANPPQTLDPQWTRTLREIQGRLADGLRGRERQLTTPAERIPPLNVLGVLTLDVARREWQEAAADARLLADRLLGELEDPGLAALGEALTLLAHTEWRKEYDFDFHYDIARIYSLRALIRMRFSRTRAEAEFAEAISHMARARDGATTRQLDAAIEALASDPTFSLLSKAWRARLMKLLRGA
jgi:hypothetical protein